MSNYKKLINTRTMAFEMLQETLVQNGFTIKRVFIDANGDIGDDYIIEMDQYQITLQLEYGIDVNNSLFHNLYVYDATGDTILEQDIRSLHVTSDIIDIIIKTLMNDFLNTSKK